MTTILSAQPIVGPKTAILKEKAQRLKALGIIPKMRVIIVGENPASLVYVNIKEKTCKKIGCDFELLRLPEDVTRELFLSEVQKMNEDPSVHGCFVQLPVPPQLRDIDVTSLIAAQKDIDGFGVQSIVDMYKGKDPFFMPCTPKGILELIKNNDIELSGKNVTVIGRSLIVGKPISLLLQNRGATVTMCHSQTKNLEEHTRNSDIIISAVGSPKFLKQTHFKDNKSQVLIDVGISRDQSGMLAGDIDFEKVKDQVKAITPVPGGIGPLTVISLMENLINAAEKISKGK
ncbi:MAG: bifunctional 5,10-methylenetetrahydrofolate dehydrogenase/5,10-methenyltetrahydrofolate cyclohydrolase [Bacteriovoracaceae bacterium]|nr:bifunctional 5,10-methylenetetrahydrofolate dehydrogenase/5,10-methenyltetrahydrofolate cyclohydrolase [Bacteriovoracaceae bacterium]